jgi:hypothetical protein
VVAEGDKQVKEELSAAVEHLELHGAAALERAPAADDEGEIVGAQLGVGVGSIGVGVTGRGEDGAGLDTGLCFDELEEVMTKMTESPLTKPLLAQSDALQVLESILLSSAVDGGILEQLALDTVVVDDGLGAAVLTRLLQLPGILLLVVDQARIVVALVEILEDG